MIPLIVYEIAEINRHTGATESDSMRLGKRVIPLLLIVGGKGVLVYDENRDKAIMTSQITEINGDVGDDVISFTTRNTTYKLRKVDDVLSESI